MMYCSRLNPACWHTRNSCRRDTASAAGHRVRPQGGVAQVLVDVDPHLADQGLLDHLGRPEPASSAPARRARTRWVVDSPSAAAIGEALRLSACRVSSTRCRLTMPYSGLLSSLSAARCTASSGMPRSAIGTWIEVEEPRPAPGEVERPGDVHDHHVAGAHHALPGCGHVPSRARALHGDRHGLGRGARAALASRDIEMPVLAAVKTRVRAERPQGHPPRTPSVVSSSIRVDPDASSIAVRNASTRSAGVSVAVSSSTAIAHPPGRRPWPTTVGGAQGVGQGGRFSPEHPPRPAVRQPQPTAWHSGPTAGAATDLMCSRPVVVASPAEGLRSPATRRVRRQLSPGGLPSRGCS